MPPCPGPSWISLSYSLISTEAKSENDSFQQFARVKVLHLGRAAGLVLALLGRVALHQQQPAGFSAA